MRTCMFAVVVALAASSALAHGPQIQITRNGSTIVTRNVIQDEPYGVALTAPKSVYVIPLKEFNGAWFAQPNNTPHAVLPGQPKYLSGPGLAYGYGFEEGGPQDFATGSSLSVRFVEGLSLWNGATFVDPGDAELKAFRGSSPAIISPASSFAVTNGGPTDLVTVDPIAAGYGSANENAHSSIRYTLLGDGASPLEPSPSGVYRVAMQIISTELGLESQTYYFLLHKFASDSALVAAVNAVGIDPSLVQWVPEPATATLLALAASMLVSARAKRSGV